MSKFHTRDLVCVFTIFLLVVARSSYSGDCEVRQQAYLELEAQEQSLEQDRATVEEMLDAFETSQMDFQRIIQ